MRISDWSSDVCSSDLTDVVPVGDTVAWTVGPFDGAVRDGQLWGRGAADMKGGIAAFVAAASRVISEHGGPLPGSISLLIAGDEEGPAVHGAHRVLHLLESPRELPDACGAGRPAKPHAPGHSTQEHPPGP